MRKIIVIAVIFVIIIALVVANFLKKEKGIEVDVAKVERGMVTQTVTGSGQIRPEVEVNVSANVAGKIIALHAEEGDSVKRGKLLVELDQEQYLAALERAQSNLLSMRANEKKLKSELIRAENLRSKGLLSDAEYEAVVASYEAAESNTKQAQAEVKEARDRLSKTRLHADMDGIVTRLNKEVGEIALGAQFQEDVIMTVADLSKMEAAIEVDENDVIFVSLDDTADIEIDAFVDTTFKGIVTKIANSATIKGLGTQEQVTNFEVTVALVDYNAKFRPGMSTTVDIITETKDDVLKVPIQSVTVREREKLYKKPGIEEHSSDINDEDNQDKAEKKDMVEVVFCMENNQALIKPIQLGISDDAYYEVLSGIQEGETVITGPFRVLSRTLKNEDLVEVKEKEKE
jgi:HlyD family secretion protein